MKAGYSISIDQEVMVEFKEIMDEEGYTTSRVIQTLMKKYIDEYQELVDTDRLISCGECDAKYSKSLDACPNCKALQPIQDEKRRERIDKELQPLIEDVEAKKKRFQDTEKWLEMGTATEKEVMEAKEALEEAERALEDKKTEVLQSE